MAELSFPEVIIQNLSFEHPILDFASQELRFFLHAHPQNQATSRSTKTRLLKV